jgi:hypothetical protein
VLVTGDEPELDDLRIGQEVERHEIGARLLDRRELLFQQLLRRRHDSFGHATRAVTDDLVHLGRQLARERTPPAGALGFLSAPRELDPHSFRRRLVVSHVDVRQRHRLAAMLLANELVVRQVDADRRDRP